MSRLSPETPEPPREPEPRVEDQVRELRRRCSELELDNRGLKRTLSEVGRARDHFRQAFDEAPVGYCIVDAAGRILKLNSSAAGFLGLSAERCVGHPLSAFVSGADGTLLDQHLEQVLQAEQQARSSVELRLEREDGTRVHVRLSSILLSDDAEAWRCLVTVTDLTQLYLLQESDALLRRIAAHVEDVYYQTDEAGHVVHVNLAYEQVWGRDAVQTRGQPWFHAVYADDLPQANEAKRLLLKGDPFDEEYRIVRGDGAVRWIRDRAFSIEQPTPQIVGVARDVTDDRELEEELRQAQKLEALGTLASSVAHDFGNLLQGVMGCLNIALSDTASPERARDYTRQALMAVRGGASLVGQLMKFGRKERAHPRAMGVDTAISGCAKLLQRLLGDHIQLNIEAHAPHGAILADPVQLEQILMNLAANARDAMPAGGRLLIKTAVVHAQGALNGRHFVRLEVRDIGCGMDPATQERIFEPFFTTKAAGKGTGLGLSAVRAVTRALGGQVDVESELGRGTSFVFHFPCVAAPPAIVHRAPEVTHFTGRALLVEDDWSVRISVRQYLEDLGFEVVEASDAVEAMSRAKGALALLVIDVVLPDVTGPKIREMLKSEYPDLKALYISAHPAPYLMEQGLLQKTDMILQKPFEMQELAFRLSELCPVPGAAGLVRSARGGMEAPLQS